MNPDIAWTVMAIAGEGDPFTSTLTVGLSHVNAYYKKQTIVNLSINDACFKVQYLLYMYAHGRQLSSANNPLGFTCLLDF